MRTPLVKQVQFSSRLTLAVGLLLAPSQSWAQEAADLDFSIDGTSPSSGKTSGSGTGKLAPQYVLYPFDPVGPPPRPGILAKGSDIGLQAGDELDGLSTNKISAPNFFLFFSVSRTSVGRVAAIGTMAPLGFVLPFNVQDQATRRQVGGDVFLGTEIFSIVGDSRVGGMGLFNNTLCLNQAVMSGQNCNLVPARDPRKSVPLGTSADNLDAMTDCCSGRYGTQGLIGTTKSYYMSLATGSPTLPTVPGSTPSGADVLQYDAVASALKTFATAAALGLQATDDIDGLIVGDSVDTALETGSWEEEDYVIFTLRPGSVSLASAGASPADVFIRHFEDAGPLSPADILAHAEDLGLDPDTDAIDGLDPMGAVVAFEDTAAISQYIAQVALFGGMNLQVSALTGGDVGLLQVTLGKPSKMVYVFVSGGPYLPTPVGPLGATLAIDVPVVIASGATDASGTANFSWTVPLADSGSTLYFQAAQTGLVSEVAPVYVNFP